MEDDGVHLPDTARKLLPRMDRYCANFDAHIRSVLDHRVDDDH